MIKRIVVVSTVLCTLLTCCSEFPSKINADVPIAVSSTKNKLNCLEIINDATDIKSNDILILDSRRVGENNRYSDFDTYFVDMAAGSWNQVAKPSENLDFFSISPDYKWIAYSQTVLDKKQDFLKHNLVVANGHNQIQKTLQWEDTWGPINWLNSQHLIVQLMEQRNEGENLSFLELNPFTGNRESIKPDFPDMYLAYPIPYWDGWKATAYNPMKTMLVYLQGNVSGPYHYTLWDIEQNEPITSIQVFGEFNAVPRWSSDGEVVAFAPSLYSTVEDYPHYEIFSIDKEGIITQLTNLADHYQWVYISDLTWSPDGRYLAFWFSYWEDKEPDFYSTETRYLAVVDISNDLVTNYCISGEKDAAIGASKYPRPLWSPDSQQIVIQSQNTDDSFITVLIDIQQEKAFQIAEDLAPVGWLQSP